MTTSKRINSIAYAVKEGLIEFRDEEVQPLDDNSVLIEIKASALCGGDIKLFYDKHPFVALPAALGHEMAGAVVEKGKGVKDLAIGNKVVVEPIVTCDKCPQCGNGSYHLCEKVSFLYRQGAGGIAKYLSVPAKWVHLLPEELTYEEGALVEPLAVALHSWKKADIRLGESVCIIGCGPIGLLLIQLAYANGCNKIIAVDRREYRLELAKELGATNTVLPGDGDTVEQVIAATGDRGVNVAFEAAGSPESLSQCLNLLNKNGRLIIVGLFSQPQVEVPVNLIVKKEITVKGSQAYCWDFQDAIQLLVSNKINLRKLISHRFKISDVEEALRVASTKEEKPIKVVLLSQ